MTFATYAVLEAGKAVATNSLTAFDAMTLPGCQGCEAVRQGVAAQIAEDRWCPVQRIDVQGAQTQGPLEGDRIEVLLLGTEKAAQVVNGTGEVVGRVEKSTLRLRLGLVWTEAGWRLQEMAPVAV